MKMRLILWCASLAMASAETKLLFNGKNLDGWSMTGPGRFVVTDGMLRTEGGMGLLFFTGRKLGNETLRVVFRTEGEAGNSGVVIRMPEAPPDPWYGVHNGYEVQIDAAGDEWHMTGAIYSLSRATKKTQKPAGEWNTMEIQMEGLLTRVSLNGEIVNEFRGNSEVPPRKQWYEPVRGPRPDRGYIGLQNHDPESIVYFKEVSVTPSPLSPLPMERGERDRILSYYHATRKQILDATADLSDAQWKFKPGPERWSIAEVIEHLALTEEFLFGYATSFLSKPVPAPSDKKITTDQMVANMVDRSQPAPAPAELRPTGRWQSGSELRSQYQSRRDHMIEWLNETEEPVTTTWGKWASNTVTVYDALHTIPAHNERHLKQINEVKADPKYPAKP